MSNKILVTAIIGVLAAGGAVAAYQGMKNDYAEVLEATPITERETVMAQVTSAEPIRETRSGPREVCEDVVVQERAPERDGLAGGTAVGAVVGGLLGNQVGDGRGRTAATIAGAVAGGYAGREIDRRHQGGRVTERVDRQCQTITETREEVVGYRVSWRDADGQTGQLQTERRPGDEVSLGERDRVVGYDVTYRYLDQVNTVRMDNDPGERLPVIDGAVVTQTVRAGAPAPQG
jgi:uncharacterized protein YcfJ